jgi:hypothetical protein
MAMDRLPIVRKADPPGQTPPLSYLYAQVCAQHGTETSRELHSVIKIYPLSRVQASNYILFCLSK